MNSSSELPGTAYLPMEYREASEASAEAEPIAPTADELPAPPPAEPVVQAPDPAELFAARLEEERRIIATQARQEAEREIQRVRSEVGLAVEAFAQQRHDYFRQAEKEVVNLALAIARHIIHRETQIDPHLVVGLVNYELEQLDAGTSTRLFVSPGTLGVWSEALPGLSGTVELVADKSLSPGDVRIETTLGTTSVSFERELKEIESGFFDLLSLRPAAPESKSVRVQ